MTGLRFRVGAVVAVVALFAYLALANLASEEARIASPLLPDQGLRLGLDLQGGIHWVLGVKLDTAVDHELEFLAGSLAENAAQNEYAVGDVDAEGQQLRVEVSASANATAIRTLGRARVVGERWSAALKAPPS